MRVHAQEIARAATMTHRCVNKGDKYDHYYKNNRKMRLIAERWMFRGGWVVATYKTMRELYGPLFTISGDDELRCIWAIGGMQRFTFIPVVYLEE